MGNICGFNIFDYLLKEYGEELAKLISIEKAKDFLATKVANLKTATGKESEKVKGEAFQKIDTQEKELDKEFEGVKGKLNSEVPGGVSSIEKMKGDSIENILGYKSFKNEFEEMKKTAGDKFAEE